MELRETILEGTIKAFNKKGLKFTMDDIAKTLGMSKKTIYTVFSDKESMFYAMVDYMFDSIKESERRIVEDDTLSTIEKIRRIMSVMPDSYINVDFQKLYQLKDKYPAVYKQVERRLETGWEDTIALLEQGMEEGCIRNIHIPIVKMMLEASLEQFFQRDILIQNKITYIDALNEVVEILMEGIAVNEAY
ncbi:MAG: TetR/AcrR family transcriptional regulator [Lachnospiraceae bacterium]|nr:TetR/AcrR family transcriptional regulator [Lachnospiraceae bacterium]